MASSPAAGSEGHIDIAFEITKHGRARNVQIVDATANAADDKRRRAVELARTGLYRPRAADGEIADGSRVVWRYHW